MRTNKIFIVLLLFSLPFLQGLQCDRYEGYEDVPPEFQFKETISVEPYKQNYAIGDTVWLRINIPEKKLYDEKTGARILFESALFNSLAQVHLLYNNPFVGDGPFARFVFPQGISASSNNYSYTTQAIISFGCAPSDNYNLLLGIVLLKKGVYGLTFNTGSIQQCGTNNYKNSKLNLTFDVTNTHKELYQGLPFEDIGKKPDNYVLEALDKKQMVIIQVL